MKLFEGLLPAFTFLTTLPLGGLGREPEKAPPGKMFGFFPLVGLVIGMILGVVTSITFLPKDLTAFLALMAWVAITGGLHLDGLADSCDGLFATVAPERRLEIMRDPRAGSWAVIGVELILLGKWVVLRNVSPAMLLLPPIAGRWAMVLAVAMFPSARSTGLAALFRAGFGRVQVISASVTAVLLIVALSLLFDRRLLSMIIITPVVVYLGGRGVSGRLGGGLTGDVYGAICEVVELMCLIALNIV